MDKALHVILTQTTDHRPLVVVDNLPGRGADLLPSQLRALAAALLAAADDCDACMLPKKGSFAIKREYPLR